MGTIVVGVDGSEPGRSALRWAMDEAALRGATVRAVHVWSPLLLGGSPYTGLTVDPKLIENEAERLLDLVVDEALGEYPDVEVERLTVCGSPAGSLLDSAKDADLVVVGSRGRGGFAGLVLGSVSAQVAHHAECPVVIVRS